MGADAEARSFESLYRDHFSSVHRFVYQYVHNAAIADELTQDAFLKALKGWAAYRGEAPERVWLLRIARNVCLDYLREPRSQRAAAASIDSLLEEQAEARMMFAAREESLSVEDSVRLAQMTDCVQDFVHSLAESLRTPLILHDIEGLTNGEIAEVLGCSVEAAKMRLHRARAKLKEMMEERCDLFHDERNVLSCLPAPPKPAFVPVGDLRSRPARPRSPR